MKKKKRVGIAILTIIALALCGGAGYFLFDYTIDINSADSVFDSGNWCVKLESVDDTKKDSLSFEKTQMNFTVDLNNENNEYNQEFLVTNCGTLDAYLFSWKIDGVDKAEDISYAIDGINIGDIVSPGKSIPVSINITNKKDKDIKSDLNLQMNFSKYNNE